MNTIWQSASEEMYKNTGGEGQAQQPGPDASEHQTGGSNKGSGGDEVTDVDFEEVK